EPSGLRKFLASLFSPMVLRYAIPALGLIVVAAIGVFVLRQKKTDGSGSIAQNVKAPTSPSITTTSSPEPVQPTRGLTDQSKEQASAGKPAQSSGSPANEPAAAAPGISAATGAVADTSREAAAKKEEQQPVVTEAPPPAPKPATPSDEYKRAAEAEARKEASPDRYANEPPAEKTVNAAKVEDRKKDAEIAQARADSAGEKVQSFGVA